jgi:energy-coupling factor transporter transmembrane protein EcfT
MVPLFLSALRRAEDLTLAMEARGYTGGKGRTSLIQLRSVPSDYLALALVTVLCTLVAWYNFRAIDGLVATAAGGYVKDVASLIVR